jgi:rubrerythrin
MELNAVELFKIAQIIEQKGITFYEKAWDYSNKDKEKEIFLKLANMEREHLRFFSLMERKAENCSYQNQEDVEAYLREHFPSSFFNEDDSRKIGKELKEMKEIIEFSIEREKDSIEFYNLISKKLTNIDDSNLKALMTIIKEEESHVKMLKELL